MKFTFFGYLIAVSAILFTACNGGEKNRDNSNAASPETATEGSNQSNANADAEPMKAVIQHYLHVKNALADDNGSEAANGAKALAATLENTDPSKFTDEQKKVYNDVLEDLKEHAEHTAGNADKIDHQREHFVSMSADVHDLVKAFGTSQTLYLDHCPMADNNKGANWISETEEIRNPYMGKKMPKCGKVEQVIK